jgi:hypothetical protein
VRRNAVASWIDWRFTADDARIERADSHRTGYLGADYAR